MTRYDRTDAMDCADTWLEYGDTRQVYGSHRQALRIPAVAKRSNSPSSPASMPATGRSTRPA